MHLDRTSEVSSVIWKCNEEFKLKIGDQFRHMRQILQIVFQNTQYSTKIYIV
jgi:hypothetical protein